MQIGAIGGMSYQPYVYNTNQLSRASMNRISGISDDALAGGVDFTSAAVENVNPLKPGQTVGFADILMSQMQMSAARASQVMKTADEMAIQ